MKVCARYSQGTPRRIWEETEGQEGWMFSCSRLEQSQRNTILNFYCDPLANVTYSV